MEVVVDTLNLIRVFTLYDDWCGCVECSTNLVQLLATEERVGADALSREYPSSNFSIVEWLITRKSLNLKLKVLETNRTYRFETDSEPV